DALAHAQGQTGGIACDHADGLCAVKNVVEDLVADQAGGSGDDDHENHLQVGWTEVAWTETGTPWACGRLSRSSFSSMTSGPPNGGITIAFIQLILSLDV